MHPFFFFRFTFHFGASLLTCCLLGRGLHRADELPHGRPRLRAHAEKDDKRNKTVVHIRFDRAKDVEHLVGGTLGSVGDFGDERRVHFSGRVLCVRVFEQESTPGPHRPTGQPSFGLMPATRLNFRGRNPW